MSCGPMVFQGIEIVGFLYWVEPIDHQSTTQLMFHTLKCTCICFFWGVVHKSQLCWNIHSLCGILSWMQWIGLQGNWFLLYLFVVAFQLQFLVLMKLWHNFILGSSILVHDQIALLPLRWLDTIKERTNYTYCNIIPWHPQHLLNNL